MIGTVPSIILNRQSDPSFIRYNLFLAILKYKDL